jgi:hypothetical protein
MATTITEGTDGSPGGQHLHFHLRQRAVTPESKTVFAATGRVSRVITSNPVIRRFESRLAQSSMAFANMWLSSWGKYLEFAGIMFFTIASEPADRTLRVLQHRFPATVPQKIGAGSARNHGTKWIQILKYREKSKILLEILREFLSGNRRNQLLPPPPPPPTNQFGLKLYVAALRLFVWTSCRAACFPLSTFSSVRGAPG